MKRTLLLSLMAVIVTVACKKEPVQQTPPPSVSNEEQLASGDWIVTDVNASGVVDFMGTPIPFIATSDSIDESSFFDFITDPNLLNYEVTAYMLITTGVSSVPFPYQQSGDGEWELVGRDSLYVTEDAQTVGYEILTWTNTRLILRVEQTIDYNGQTADAQVEIELKR